MHRFTELLLEVWQEAGRYSRIAESTERIAELLRGRIPLHQVIVRRLELPNRQIRTVATGLASPAEKVAALRTPLTPEELNAIVALASRQRTLPTDSGADKALRERIMPPGLARGSLIGVLRSDAGPLGFLILVAPAGAVFEPVHSQLLEELLAPFTLALENDQRLLALETDRQAAEADRQALLRRLGRESLHEAIVGATNGLQPVMDRVAQVAHADVPVLIFGETGSGKEVIARAIHDGSPRHEGPFLRVNCGAIPTELVDSELFGHERGSFTGAVGTRQGWFERANGGTLFLDEIAELPLAAQVRLLRVIQDGVFERVGGQRALEVDVRIVGATHRDLQRMVAEHRFREDLWYRLAVFPIFLPPLRERLEDLPALALHFAQRAARRFGLPLQTPTLADLDLMSRYAWPGNIRELAAVIDRAAILGNGARLEIGQSLGMPGAIAGSAQRPAADRPVAHPAVDALPGESTPTPQAVGVFESLDVAMRRHIEAALLRTRGRIDGPRGAARLLQINPHTLRARMRKLGVDWRAYRQAGAEAG
ncbi:MAG TPA: sigma-54 dependent transcriptional regulator [Phycisphaerae bacterium]|nr:sigma-54 dependent transcriptional regulator [Phycisphaerae bacterium]